MPKDGGQRILKVIQSAGEKCKEGKKMHTKGNAEILRPILEE